MRRALNKLAGKLDEYTQNHGGVYKEWYVGITPDLEQRLFNQHRVNRLGIYDWDYADSNRIARMVEKFFLALGCDGNPGGGDESSTIVYVYKKTRYINP